MGEYETFSFSEYLCKLYGGVVATIRNKYQLKAVENIARKAYDRMYVSMRLEKKCLGTAYFTLERGLTSL